MILSDRELRARLDSGEISIEPPIDREVQLQPASIDLRLGSEFITYKLPNVPVIDSRDPSTIQKLTEKLSIAEGEAFTLHPGEFALGTTLEWVKVPNDLVARVEGRSSIGRLAVVVHATAGFVDPGFEGRITLELSNLGRVGVMLYPNMRISQLVFHTMTSPSERPYGPGRGSKYWGQEGPVASRISKEPRVITRERLPDGRLRLAAERVEYTFRRIRPGTLVMTIAGQENGALGRAPMGEVAAETALHPPLRMFIDMTALTYVASAVSDEWTAWFRAHREEIKKVDVLSPSPNVALVVAVSQKFSELEKIMRLHRDAATFAEALSQA